MVVIFRKNDGGQPHKNDSTKRKRETERDILQTFVAKDKIHVPTAKDVKINNAAIPIGRSYKELAMLLLKEKSNN
jgi:hypothetical protein